MTLARWLRPLAARLTRGRPRPADPRPRFHPRVEGLEDRSTPTAVQLTNTNFVTGPTNMTPVGSSLYFEADTGTGNQLWRSDGRPGDAARVDSGSQPVDPTMQAR